MVVYGFRLAVCGLGTGRLANTSLVVVFARVSTSGCTGRMALNGDIVNRTTHIMPQFKHLKGGPKDCDDAPIDYLPAGNAATPSMKRGDTKQVPSTPSKTAHPLKQNTHNRKMGS